MKWLVPDDIKAKIIAHSFKYAPKEVGGVLFGKEVKGNLLINDIEVLSVGKNVEVQMTTALASKVAEYNEREKVIVGWWHSHPFNMPNFSRTDTETQIRFSQQYPKALGILAYKDAGNKWRVKGYAQQKEVDI